MGHTARSDPRSAPRITSKASPSDLKTKTYCNLWFFSFVSPHSWSLDTEIDYFLFSVFLIVWFGTECVGSTNILVKYDQILQLGPLFFPIRSKTRLFDSTNRIRVLLSVWLRRRLIYWWMIWSASWVDWCPTDSRYNYLCNLRTTPSVTPRRWWVCSACMTVFKRSTRQDESVRLFSGDPLESKNVIRKLYLSGRTERTSGHHNVSRRKVFIRYEHEQDRKKWQNTRKLVTREGPSHSSGVLVGCQSKGLTITSVCGLGVVCRVRLFPVHAVMVKGWHPPTSSRMRQIPFRRSALSTTVEMRRVFYVPSDVGWRFIGE